VLIDWPDIIVIVLGLAVLIWLVCELGRP